MLHVKNLMVEGYSRLYEHSEKPSLIGGIVIGLCDAGKAERTPGQQRI